MPSEYSKILDLRHTDCFTTGSRARYPNRVFVERSPDVRENEAVMRWY